MQLEASRRRASRASSYLPGRWAAACRQRDEPWCCRRSQRLCNYPRSYNTLGKEGLAHCYRPVTQNGDNRWPNVPGTGVQHAGYQLGSFSAEGVRTGGRRAAWFLSSVTCVCFFCAWNINPVSIMWLLLFSYLPAVADVEISDAIYHSILIENNSSCRRDLIWRVLVMYLPQLYVIALGDQSRASRDLWGKFQVLSA